MMMNGMAGGMVWGTLLAVVLLLGFAYIVWVLSAKEKGNIKIVGQVIAIIVTVLALWILLYGGVYGGMMGKGMHGRSGRGYKMMDKGEKSYKFMEKMMQEPGMHEWMEKYVEENKK